MLLNEVFPFGGAFKDLKELTAIAGKPWRELFHTATQLYSEFTNHPFADNPVDAVVLGRYEATLNVVEVAIAYAFEKREYEEDLRRHGVPAPRD